ncbi:MAG: S1C family serine protease [Gaiellaceae bacterium]
MRPGAIAVIALVSAVVGAAAVLLLGKATGVIETEGAQTVFVPTDAADFGPNGGARTAPAARPLAGNGFHPARVYSARSAGVVTVYSFFDDPREPKTSQGSGFVVSQQGVVLTSAHVITDAGQSESGSPDGADRVFVGFKNGDRVRAQIVGWDVFDDVGVLRVDPSDHDLAPVPLGDSSKVVVGEPVAAMGSPFGNQDSLAVGVVSANRRSIDALTSLYRVVDAIQTDAPITHGNSGGPLFDARGRVIGINAQIRSQSGESEGVGFAIPINAAKRSMQQLLASGRVAYGYVGVTTEDLTPSVARHFRYRVQEGAVVATVSDDSPGDKAGLRGGSGEEVFNGETVTRGGDLIVAIDGEPVRSADDVVRAVAYRLPGQVVRFTLVRGGKRLSVRVRLGERPTAPEVER